MAFFVYIFSTWILLNCKNVYCFSETIFPYFYFRTILCLTFFWEILKKFLLQIIFLQTQTIFLHFINWCENFFISVPFIFSFGNVEKIFHHLIWCVWGPHMFWTFKLKTKQLERAFWRLKWIWRSSLEAGLRWSRHHASMRVNLTLDHYRKGIT